jgi:hypothetical protein
MSPVSSLEETGFFRPVSGGRMSTLSKPPRSRWKPNRSVLPDRAVPERLRPAAEVIATRCEPDGSVCGPYEQSYTVDRGYAFDRPVIRP